MLKWPFFVIAFVALTTTSIVYAQLATSEPQRGEIADSVLARLGEPTKKHRPVGDPPISRWVYEDFTVYFEGTYVIHTVSNEIKSDTKPSDLPE